MNQNTVTGRICAECTEREDPAPWCDCRPAERCTGPCRWRAHAPADCPFRTAYVPHPTPWHLVGIDDVIQSNNGGLLQVTDVERAPQWRLKIGGQWLSPPGIVSAEGKPIYPVPVLVPYAERAAQLVLRENDRQHGHASEVIERG